MANNAAARIEPLVAIARTLRAIIEAETRALNERRPSFLKDTEVEKTRLSKIYTTEMTALRRDKAFLQSLAPPDRNRLAAEMKAFNDALAAHATTVKAMKTVSERMIQAIAIGAQKLAGPAATYGKNAQFAATPPPKAFALNSMA